MGVEVVGPALEAPEGLPRLKLLCEGYLSYVEPTSFWAAASSCPRRPSGTPAPGRSMIASSPPMLVDGVVSRQRAPRPGARRPRRGSGPRAAHLRLHRPARPGQLPLRALPRPDQIHQGREGIADRLARAGASSDGSMEDRARAGHKSSADDPDGQRNRPSASRCRAVDARHLAEGIGRGRSKGSRASVGRHCPGCAESPTPDSPRCRSKRRGENELFFEHRSLPDRNGREHAAAGVSPATWRSSCSSDGHWDHVTGLEGLGEKLGRTRLPALIHRRARAAGGGAASREILFVLYPREFPGLYEWQPFRSVGGQPAPRTTK